DRGSREHYADADLYDHEYRRRRDDVRYYRALAQRLLGGPGRILELGCGSGRLTLPLLRDGHQVVAVDGSPTMLAALERRLGRAGAAARGRARVVEGDLRDFAVGGRFPLVIAAFNVLEHLYTRVELAACLARVAAHLAPGGHLAFDVQLPDPRWLARDPSRRWARTRFTHPRTGVPMIYSTNHDYDPVSQIALIRLYYERADGRGRARVVHLSQRKYFPAELEGLLAWSGFRIVERRGDFHGAPLTAGAESQVLVCARAGRRPRR
ncbi:MAG: methyltransferase domain-containing protein, partial [Myxococcales bacterium]|nr:methyltransferase domain-containing protein [Myxococcales bacterium]